MTPKSLSVSSDRLSRIAQQVQEWFPAITVSISVVILWQISIVVFDIPRYVLPRPSAIAEEISTKAGTLLYHLSWTMGEALGGCWRPIPRLPRCSDI